MPSGLGKERKRSSRVVILAVIIVAVLVLAAVAWLTVQIVNNGYTKHSTISIDGNGGFTKANGVVRGSGTASDPYIISDWNINASTTHGISIFHTDAHFIVRNCYVHDGTPVHYTGSSYNGIYLYECVNGTLENNRCSNNYASIALVLSRSITVIDNTCSNNQIGMNVLSSTNDKLSENDVSNNQDGIFLLQSHNNTLRNNSCNSNHHDGISLYYWSNNNDIAWNLVRNNTGYGVNVSAGPACTNNRIWNNIIISNHGATNTYIASNAQARDDGTNNYWNSTDAYDNHGNYWSDWTTPDALSPVGIVDHPYIIPGSAGAKDYYPLSNDPRYIQVENLS